MIGIAAPQFLGLSLRAHRICGFRQPIRVPRTPADDAHLKPGVMASQARAALNVLFGQLAQEQPGIVAGNRPGQPPAQVELLAAGKGLSALRAQYQRPLLALTGLVTWCC